MEQSHTTAIKREFLIERQGRTFALYAGLLDLAHSQGLRAIRTTLVQIPSEDNYQVAIVAAEVETERGVFCGIGDASPANVSRAMLTCTIRLAETRAKARALRDAVNVGVAALEELDDQEASEMHAAPVAPPPARAVAASTPSAKATVTTPASPDAPTRAQLGGAYSLGKQRGQSDTDVDRLSVSWFGAPPTQLSRSQVADLIDRLKALKAPGDSR